MEKKILILDQQRISLKLERMAYQIWESYSHETELIMVGIDGTGYVVAARLAARLSEISPIRVDLVRLTINKRLPLSEDIVLDKNLTGKSVVLVDDVADSGRTLLYALKPMLDYEPNKILTAVLVDRKHKSFPVSPDIVGHSLATTLQEHIEVSAEGDQITGAYLS